MYRQCLIKLVKEEIPNKKGKPKTVREDLTSVRDKFSLKLSFIDVSHVCNLVLIENNKAILKDKQIQNKKRNSLRVATSENDPDGFL